MLLFFYKGARNTSYLRLRFEKEIPERCHKHWCIFSQKSCQINLHLFGIRGRLLFVFQKTHGILNDDFVFEPYEFNNFFGDPRSDDCQVNFPHVYLFVKLGRKFHGFEKLELLVRKSSILVGRSAFEEASVCHRLQKDRSFSMMLTELNKDRENLVVLTFNSFKLQFNDAVYIMVTLSLPSLRLLSMPYRYRELCMADGQCDLYLVE